MTTSMPRKQPNTVVNGECTASFFSNRRKYLCLGLSLCTALPLCISLCLGGFLRSLFPVQETCRGFCCCHSLCRGEKKIVLFCCLTAYKGVPNEGPDCHGLRNKWDMGTKDVVEQMETFSILQQDQEKAFLGTGFSISLMFNQS